MVLNAVHAITQTSDLLARSLGRLGQVVQGMLPALKQLDRETSFHLWNENYLILLFLGWSAPWLAATISSHLK